MTRFVCNAVLVSIFAICANRAHADTANEIFARGNNAYAHGQYDAAIAEYSLLIDSGIADADVTFNLATAHARASRFGEAIRWYERTLALRPGDDDAERGIAAATSVLGTRRAQVQGEAVVQTRPPMLESLAQSFSLTTLGLVTLALEFALFGLLIGLLFARRESLRLGLGIAVPAFVVATALFGVVFAEKLGVFRSGQSAVVLREHADVRDGADSDSRLHGEAFEGERIHVLSRHGDFARVRLSNGRIGFMRRSDVGEI